MNPFVDRGELGFRLRFGGGVGGRGFGGPRGMEISAEIATDLFMLSGESTGYTGISAAN